MKKVILGIALVAVSVSTVFAKTDVPTKTVKLGELVNGEIKLTYDVTTLKQSLGVIVAQDNQEIQEAALFVEDGQYYLWGSIVNKTTKVVMGKLLISVEKDKSNNFQLLAKPVWRKVCVANDGCLHCSTSGTSCWCDLSSTQAWGSCYWKNVLSDDGTALYDKAFDELFKKQG